LTSFTDFQLVVEFNVILHSEGECNASIIFGDKAAPHKSDGAQSAPNSLFNYDSKFIVVSNLPTNCSDTFTKMIVTSMFGQSNQSLLSDDFQLVVKLIPILTSEGARAPSSKLIVGCGYSKISFRFCEDCRIFCEGVKDSTIGIVSNNGIVGRIDHIGLNLFGHNGLLGYDISLIGLGFVGFVGIGLVSLASLVGNNGLAGRNDLVDRIGLNLFSHNGLNSFIGLGVSFIGPGFVGFIGLCLVSIAGFIIHISQVGVGGFSGISGLVGQISLVNLSGISGISGISGCIDHNGLIGLIGISLVSLVSSATLALALSDSLASAT